MHSNVEGEESCFWECRRWALGLILEELPGKIALFINFDANLDFLG
jgi:hypothetical protein